jgi:hypothetical protein
VARTVHDRNGVRPVRPGSVASGVPASAWQRLHGPVASALSGTGRIADDLYLMGHSDVTGRALLQPRPLGIGLAGGLLAELALDGGLAVRPDGLVVAGQVWPEGDLARVVLGQIRTERELRPVREWLLFLARTAAGQVAVRLAQAGYLTRARGWVPGRPGRWRPVNSDWAFASVGRVRSALDPSRPFDHRAVAVAALAVACGLGFRFEHDQSRASRTVEEAVSYLPPGVRALIAQTQATVDSAVLSHRT